MRIFQAIHAATNPRVPGSNTWYRNLYEPLIEMGHEVVLFSTDEGSRARRRSSKTLRSTFSNKLFETFQQEQEKRPFDLFFSYLTDGMVDPAVIDEIGKTGVPTCNFSCNNAHQFYLVKEISPHFNLNLHSEKDSHSKFLAIGANPLWWPMASNPKYFKPVKASPTIPVSFIGANYALRAHYIEHLLESGVDVHAYGPGWLFGTSSRWRSIAKRYKYLLLAAGSLTSREQHAASSRLADHDFRRSLSECYPNNLHPPVTDEELISLYSRSQISLGFLEVYDHHDPTLKVTRHLHLREFEAPMSGAFYMTGYTEELAEMFEPDKEVVVYRNRYELLDKLNYFLTHPEETKRIRIAGRARALKDHTCHRRFDQLFKSLNLSDK